MKKLKNLFKVFRKQQKTGNQLVDYYNSIDEDSRLLSRHGQIEFLTTIKYIEKYLKPDMQIIEIGAATGRYSHYFARKGFSVDAVDLIDHNIEIFKANTKPDEKVSITKGNATDLKDFSDNTYDVTLLLGPMYHLYDVTDQKKALKEAIRITKPDGIIFVAYCMVDAGILTGAFKNNRVNELIERGLLNPETFDTFYPPNGIFKQYTKTEIEQLTEEFNVKRLHFVATDGYACHMKEELKKMDKKTYEFYKTYHFTTCERQDMIGISHHTLDVLRKE